MANNRTGFGRVRGSLEDLVGSLPITEPLLTGRSPLEFFYGLPYRPSQPSPSPSPHTSTLARGLTESDSETDLIEDGGIAVPGQVPVPGGVPGPAHNIFVPGRGTRRGTAAPPVRRSRPAVPVPAGQAPYPASRQGIVPIAGRRSSVPRTPSPFGSLASLDEKLPFLRDEEQGGAEEDSEPPEKSPSRGKSSRPPPPRGPAPAPAPAPSRAPAISTSRAREDGTTSLKSSIFNLSNTMIGAGMMALPAAMNVLGVVTGSLALIFVALLTYGSVMAMVRCTVTAAEAAGAAEAAEAAEAGARRGAGREGNARGGGLEGGAREPGRKTYGSVGSRSMRGDDEKLSYNHTVAKALGSTGRLVLQVSIVVNNLGLMMVFLDIIGDVLVGSSTGAGVLPLDQLRLPPEVARMSVLSIVLLLILPLCLQDRLGSMKLASKISVALAIAFVLLVLLLSGGKIAAGAATMPPLFATSGHVLAVFSVINVVTNAFICHFNVTPIYRELRDRSLPRMRTVVRCSVIITTLVYLAVGIFGLVLFGPDVHTDVLYDFDTDLDVVPGMSPVVAAHAVVLGQGVKVGYAVSRVLSLPLALFQLRLVVASLLSSCVGRKRGGSGGGGGRGGSGGSGGSRDEGRESSSGSNAGGGKKGEADGEKGSMRVNSLGYIQVDGADDGEEEAGEREGGNEEEEDGEEGECIEEGEGEEMDSEEEEEEDEEARLEEQRKAEAAATRRRRFWRQVRFVLLTVFLLVLAFCGAVLVPDIWIVFQFMGCTAAVIIGFVFPGLVALRAKGGTASVSDAVVAWLLVLVGVSVGIIGIVVNIVVLSSDGVP